MQSRNVGHHRFALKSRLRQEKMGRCCTDDDPTALHRSASLVAVYSTALHVPRIKGASPRRRTIHLQIVTSDSQKNLQMKSIIVSCLVLLLVALLAASPAVAHVEDICVAKPGTTATSGIYNVYSVATKMGCAYGRELESTKFARKGKGRAKRTSFLVALVSSWLYLSSHLQHLFFNSLTLALFSSF